jgi:hypothetical protein
MLLLISLSELFAVTGTSEEQMLHQCLLQYDEMRLRVEGYHQVRHFLFRHPNQCHPLHFFIQRIAIYISRDRCIAKHDLEELYIYLKAQIASGVDLASIADEMYQNILRFVRADRFALIFSPLH